MNRMPSMKVVLVASAALLFMSVGSGCSKDHEQEVVSGEKAQKAAPTAKKAAPEATPEAEITEVTYSLKTFAEHATVSAVVDAAPLRPGDEFRLGVVFDIDDGWHIYGNPVGPGVGRATSVRAREAPGVTFGATSYAPGHKAEQDFGDDNKTWVWESTGRVVHYVTGRIADDAALGPAKWLLEAKAQVCTATECLPSNIKIPLVVEIAGRGAKQSKEHANDFTGYDQSSVPKKES